MSGTPSLDGRTALVTGGGRGIGAAIARRLAALGASVAICGRTFSQLSRTATEIKQAGGSALAVECDVTDLTAVERLAKTVLNEFHHLDILVNNAGVGTWGAPLHQLDPREWDKIMDVNLKGVYHCIRAFAPGMVERGSGHIINISSLASKNPLPNGAAYAASKAALNGLSVSVAEELRGANVRVAVVCPGSVNTEFSPHAGKDPSKLIQPEDVAHAVAALVTQAPTSFISEILLRPTQKP
jgi:3-oxoacyl-[acyl-carrier protein] reductase